MKLKIPKAKLMIKLFLLVIICQINLVFQNKVPFNNLQVNPSNLLGESTKLQAQYTDIYVYPEREIDFDFSLSPSTTVSFLVKNPHNVLGVESIILYSSNTKITAEISYPGLSTTTLTHPDQVIDFSQSVWKSIKINSSKIEAGSSLVITVRGAGLMKEGNFRIVPTYFTYSYFNNSSEVYSAFPLTTEINKQYVYISNTNSKDSITKRGIYFYELASPNNQQDFFYKLIDKTSPRPASFTNWFSDKSSFTSAKTFAEIQIKQTQDLLLILRPSQPGDFELQVSEYLGIEKIEGSKNYYEILNKSYGSGFFEIERNNIYQLQISDPKVTSSITLQVLNDNLFDIYFSSKKPKKLSKQTRVNTVNTEYPDTKLANILISPEDSNSNYLENSFTSYINYYFPSVKLASNEKEDTAIIFINLSRAVVKPEDKILASNETLTVDVSDQSKLFSYFLFPEAVIGKYSKLVIQTPEGLELEEVAYSLSQVIYNNVREGAVFTEIDSIPNTTTLKYTNLKYFELHNSSQSRVMVITIKCKSLSSVLNSSFSISVQTNPQTLSELSRGAFYQVDLSYLDYISFTLTRRTPAQTYPFLSLSIVKTENKSIQCNFVFQNKELEGKSLKVEEGMDVSNVVLDFSLNDSVNSVIMNAFCQDLSKKDTKDVRFYLQYQYVQAGYTGKNLNLTDGNFKAEIAHWDWESQVDIAVNEYKNKFLDGITVSNLVYYVRESVKDTECFNSALPLWTQLDTEGKASMILLQRDLYLCMVVQDSNSGMVGVFSEKSLGQNPAYTNVLPFRSTTKIKSDTNYINISLAYNKEWKLIPMIYVKSDSSVNYSITYQNSEEAKKDTQKKFSSKDQKHVYIVNGEQPQRSRRLTEGKQIESLFNVPDIPSIDTIRNGFDGLANMGDISDIMNNGINNLQATASSLNFRLHRDKVLPEEEIVFSYSNPKTNYYSYTSELIKLTNSTFNVTLEKEDGEYFFYYEFNEYLKDMVNSDTRYYGVFLDEEEYSENKLDYHYFASRNISDFESNIVQFNRVNSASIDYDKKYYFSLFAKDEFSGLIAQYDVYEKTFTSGDVISHDKFPGWALVLIILILIIALIIGGYYLIKYLKNRKKKAKAKQHVLLEEENNLE